MLDENKPDILDKPEILRRESALKPVKKSKGWIFKLILVLIVIGFILYLFTHTEIIMDPVNEFFGKFS